MNESFHFIDSFDEWASLDLIIHQGAISSTTETDVEKLFNFNVLFSIKLFEKAIKYGVPVKYASSASIYGNAYPAANPLNFYALSKLQVDYWVEDNLERFTHVQGFRYFNVYGENEHHKGGQASPVFKFRNEALARSAINVFRGSEDFFRDFVWVNNLVEVVLTNNLGSGIYDLGSSKSVSFYEIAILLSEKYNAQIVEVEFPAKLKNKYQFNTLAKDCWGSYPFLSVAEYISKL